MVSSPPDKSHNYDVEYFNHIVVNFLLCGVFTYTLTTNKAGLNLESHKRSKVVMKACQWPAHACELVYQAIQSHIKVLRSENLGVRLRLASSPGPTF